MGHLIGRHSLNCQMMQFKNTKIDGCFLIYFFYFRFDFRFNAMCIQSCIPSVSFNPSYRTLIPNDSIQMKRALVYSFKFHQYCFPIFYLFTVCCFRINFVFSKKIRISMRIEWFVNLVSADFFGRLSNNNVPM